MRLVFYLNYVCLDYSDTISILPGNGRHPNFLLHLCWYPRWNTLHYGWSAWEFQIPTRPLLIPSWLEEWEMPSFCSAHGLCWCYRMALFLLGSGESPHFPLSFLWYHPTMRGQFHHPQVGVEVWACHTVSPDAMEACLLTNWRRWKSILAFSVTTLGEVLGCLITVWKEWKSLSSPLGLSQTALSWGPRFFLGVGMQ